ncbi:MAG: hypothetical protein HYR72_12805 [Deltaproteobacteria bacterium]|nr:hypothetical protein [Deltaproteobacteria bacterium]MBI3387902.1 hypothetical protein [Deltaproteobacteria bacterium]
MAPGTSASGVLTWQNLRTPSPWVMVKTRVDDHVTVPNILTAIATFTDESGAIATSSHDTLVSVESGAATSAPGVLSLSLTAPRTVRRDSSPSSPFAIVV